MTRRTALTAAGTVLAAARPVAAQRLAGEAPGRIPPVGELLNAAEFEAIAQRKLDPATFAEIAGGDRSAFERITFRPRMMVDSTKADYSVTLFGQALFMPILAGPLSQLKRYHPEGELAMVRGASAAKAPMVISARSSVPIAQIAAQSKTPLWYQVDLESEAAAVRPRIQEAIAAGCKVLCVTMGTGGQPALTAGIDWRAIDRLRQGLTVPVVLKGVMGPEEAQKAVAAGVQGIVVSNYTPHPMQGVASTIAVLPSISDAVGGKVTILIDGSFRRGSDVVKALALGAKGVMLGRPLLWGLAAYGAEGVQTVIELIQSDFARDMAMCGKTTISALDRTAVTIHRK